MNVSRWHAHPSLELRVSDAFGPYQFPTVQLASETTASKRIRLTEQGSPYAPRARFMKVSTVALITQAVQIVPPRRPAQVDRSGDA
jgi:hypothetical protein